MGKIENRIDAYMTKYPCLLSARGPIKEALELMKKKKIRHLPVVENDKLVGIISERDLKRIELLPNIDKLVIADVMTKDPYSVRVGTPLSEIAKVMAEKKYGSAIILNHQDEVVGIFTTTDGMKILSKLITSDFASETKNWKVEDFLF